MALLTFVVVHHTLMICNMQDSFLWNRMTSYGHYRPLYRAWSSEHWQLKGVVDAQGAVNSNYATSPEENTSKASPEDATSSTEDIQLGEVESRVPTGGPCMYGFRASIHLPHLSSSRPDTYLNHSGRATDPKRKKPFYAMVRILDGRKLES